MCASTPGPVFVAGATGRTGSRIVRLLTDANVPVLAGCRDAKKLTDQNDSPLITHVPYNALNETVPSLDPATVVVSALGSVESIDVRTFARVDGYGTKRLLEAACATDSVKQIMMVSSIGVGSLFKWPASMLNLLGGVLIWKGMRFSR